MNTMESTGQPLAALLRPQTLDDFIGQEHLVGEGKPLRVAIELGAVFSMIFWGPPGVGKTTLARIIAKQTQREFFEISAVSAGKSDIKAVVESTNRQRQLDETYQPPILFIDEIHRFNKAQQDFLLPFVENGTLVLIGATTENPSFEIISALQSRTRVFVLKALEPAQLQAVVVRALNHLSQTTGQTVQLEAETQEWLINFANGDARKLLTIIDTAYSLYGNLELTSLKNSLQSQLNYDRQGEEHYDTISAFIKSLRASNPDAALYYLARMVAAGEDPLFIARRLVIFASEDIGIAQPTALVVANAVFQACHTIGYPECAINLAHGVVYLARCPKNRSAYDGLLAARADVDQFSNLPIPLELRNAPTKLMKSLNYGKGYEMYPDPEKSLLPDKLKGKRYWQDLGKTAE